MRERPLNFKVYAPWPSEAHMPRATCHGDRAEGDGEGPAGGLTISIEHSIAKALHVGVKN